MSRTTFDPAVHGFPFPNRFVNEIARLPTGDRIRTSGRCGGMAFGALDIFHAGRSAPTDDWSTFPRAVPPDGTPIADFLLGRQVDSFRELSALRFVSWTLFPDDSSPFFSGVRGWTAEEVPKICAAIDRGAPVVIGLIGARKLGDVGRRNHQVVAYDYAKVTGAVRFWLYDSNTPGRRVQLEWRRAERTLIASNRTTPWRGMFLHTYAPKPPPPNLWTR